MCFRVSGQGKVSLRHEACCTAACRPPMPDFSWLADCSSYCLFLFTSTKVGDSALSDFLFCVKILHFYLIIKSLDKIESKFNDFESGIGLFRLEFCLYLFFR